MPLITLSSLLFNVFNCSFTFFINCSMVAFSELVLDRSRRLSLSLLMFTHAWRTKGLGTSGTVMVHWPPFPLNPNIVKTVRTRESGAQTDYRMCTLYYETAPVQIWEMGDIGPIQHRKKIGTSVWWRVAEIKYIWLTLSVNTKNRWYHTDFLSETFCGSMQNKLIYTDVRK